MIKKIFKKYSNLVTLLYKVFLKCFGQYKIKGEK